MVGARPEYIAAGGNRHPAAADWIPDTLAFGCGNNIALWDPTRPNQRIRTILRGHTDVVNAIKLLQCPSLKVPPILISGSADKTVRVWFGRHGFAASKCLSGHQSSINTVAVLPGSEYLVTGSADATLKVWKLDLADYERKSNEHNVLPESLDVRLVQTINLKPRYFPLATAITRLTSGQHVLAVAGTAAYVQIFMQQGEEFVLEATLTGHEGWIRSLDFVQENSASDSDCLLASASQDKYIRIWRFHKGNDLPVASAAAADPSLGALGRSLSNKAHHIGTGDSRHSITFEALLIGHEDWIYTARWSSTGNGAKTPRLLTASADNSLAIWERDPDSGFWMCVTRLGEISAQKGSTTATGSTGGFWIGLWSPDSTTVASLGRTGSWRAWKHLSDADRWDQSMGISGHVREVKDIAWSSDGSFLLSTASDQTTRLWAQQVSDGMHTWHEMSRPQIHGYDLNCIDTLGTRQFISGADEKLLRVFNKPKAVANIISKFTGFEDETAADLPEAANIPVLGLSNKAIDTAATEEEAEQARAEQDVNDRQAVDPTSITSKSALNTDHLPYEDQLARHTLWPEHEKLYGHGYEISAVCASHDGSLVATACRASSIDHAVIRIYEATEWREVKPALTAHSLTVTSLAFSPDDRYLLSTGRDRQWALFRRDADSPTTYKPAALNPKGHSRMILASSWAPQSADQYVFATAGRDKSVKIWAFTSPQDVACKVTLPTSAAATAVAFYHSSPADRLVLAYGTEEGRISIGVLTLSDWNVVEGFEMQESQAPSGAISALCWRPDQGCKPGKSELAVASDDHSVRIFQCDVPTTHVQ